MKYKILLVDDDENIIAGYKRRLRKNFIIYSAGSGEEALEIIKREGPFHIAVSDLKMPAMDGFELLSEINRKNPATICIMLTGYAELKSSLKAFNKEYIFRFLTKPCTVNVLEQTINEGIKKYLKNKAISQKQMDNHKNYFKRILIIEDSIEILSSLCYALGEKKNLEILTAENSLTAVNTLNAIQINLIVLNAVLAQKEGYKLIKFITKHHREADIVITTWNSPENLKEEFSPFNISAFFEKPLNLEIFTKTLMEDFYSGPKGIIDGISIPTFLQMIEMEEKTCTLTISSGHKSGSMFFKKGSLINSKYNEIQGEDAAYEIIAWEKAAIKIDNYCHENNQTIQKTLMNLLMEAAKMADHGDL